jgi:hypothetical protein
MRYCVLTRLARRGEGKAEGGRATDEHPRAASKFAEDYERALLGTTRALELAGVRSIPGPRDLLDPHRAAAQRRYQQACRAAGQSGAGIIEAVVIGNECPNSLAAQRNLNPAIVMGGSASLPRSIA